MTLVRMEHEHSEWASIFFVDWNLGNTCNFSCSYCPKILHDESRPWMTAPIVTSFSERLAVDAAKFGRRVYIQFTGGEARPQVQDARTRCSLSQNALPRSRLAIHGWNSKQTVAKENQDGSSDIPSGLVSFPITHIAFGSHISRSYPRRSS